MVGSQKERLCLVTHQHYPADKVLKFVLSPAHILTPDVLDKLPGDACYVVNDKSVLQQAVDQKLFDSSWGCDVEVPLILIEQVERLLKKQCLQFCALAKRSGALVAGFDKAHIKVLSGKAYLLIQAEDASEGGKKKLVKKNSNTENVLTYTCFSMEELGKILAKSHVAHVVITKKYWADILDKHITRYLEFIAQ